MKNPPRCLAAFAAAALASAALPAAAQMRAQAGAVVPSVSVLGSAFFPGAGASLSLPAPTALAAALAAPSLFAAAPIAAPVLSAAALPAASVYADASEIVIPTPGAAATHIADEAAAYAEQFQDAPPAKAVKKNVAARILDTLLNRPAASVSFDGEAGKTSAELAPADKPAAAASAQYQMLAANAHGAEESLWRFIYGTKAEQVEAWSMWAPTKPFEQTEAVIRSHVEKYDAAVQAFEAAHPGIETIRRSPESNQKIFTRRYYLLQDELRMLARAYGVLEKGWLDQNPEIHQWLVWHYGSPTFAEFQVIWRQTNERNARLISEHGADVRPQEYPRESLSL
jgi:hypothetical protein